MAADGPADTGFRLQGVLSCPICHGGLLFQDAELLTCDCGSRFPVLDGIPILIDEGRSIFKIADFVDRQETFFKPASWYRPIVDALTPTLAMSITSSRNYKVLLTQLKSRALEKPRVLVVGGAILGAGMEALAADPDITLVETDATVGPRTQVVCDAHDLPFAAHTFDAVVAQAVLEHVVDPQRCVDEMWRVLKPRGLVYVEAAFMQPVHGGAYDFMRFTRSGLLSLFSRFECVSSGVACGPGSALAYAITYFVQSFGRPRTSRKILTRVGRYLSFYFKYFDVLLAHREAALDSASSLYFLGSRREDSAHPRELLTEYRGAV